MDGSQLTAATNYERIPRRFHAAIFSTIRLGSKPVELVTGVYACHAHNGSGTVILYFPNDGVGPMAKLWS